MAQVDFEIRGLRSPEPPGDTEILIPIRGFQRSGGEGDWHDVREPPHAALRQPRRISTLVRDDADLVTSRPGVRSGPLAIDREGPIPGDRSARPWAIAFVDRHE